MSKWLDILKQSHAAAVVQADSLAAIQPIHAKPLDEILVEIAQYGHPSLMQHSDGGWSCSVDVKVNATGVDFKVRSGFKCATPREAAKECYQRLVESLKGLGVQV